MAAADADRWSRPAPLRGGTARDEAGAHGVLRGSGGAAKGPGVAVVGFGAGVVGLVLLVAVAAAMPAGSSNGPLAGIVASDAFLRVLGALVFTAVVAAMFRAVTRDSRRVPLAGAAGLDPALADADGFELAGVDRSRTSRDDAAAAGRDGAAIDRVVPASSVAASRRARVAELRAPAIVDTVALRAGQLETRVKALDARVAALTEENLALATRNAELEGFCRLVSREMLQPLRAVEGFSSVILDDHAGALPGATGHGLERIRTAARRMHAAIDAFLTLARVGDRRLAPAPADLGFLAREVVAELRERDPEHPVQFASAADLSAHGDARLLRLLLAQLLGNAWRFTAGREKPRVELGAARRFDQDTVYFVRDNGVGFDQEGRRRMFAPFERLHDARDLDGPGLGLATAARIVVLHGGRIWSEGMPGAGATVYFTLPMPSTSVEQDPPARARPSPMPVARA